ncbi:hypothetical protein Taro_036961 [Colocasia esculenta]|uniref:Uncharacterized protein n=1 Tax=Colocasia esculenta TaxID=4460 RepID=A0A843W4H0_COLES|nr:hypothetical protein [Colocasia esculenta]
MLKLFFTGIAATCRSGIIKVSLPSRRIQRSPTRTVLPEPEMPRFPYDRLGEKEGKGGRDRCLPPPLPAIETGRRGSSGGLPLPPFLLCSAQIASAAVRRESSSGGTGIKQQRRTGGFPAQRRSSSGGQGGSLAQRTPSSSFSPLLAATKGGRANSSGGGSSSFIYSSSSCGGRAQP